MLGMGRPMPANLSAEAMSAASTGSSAHRPPQHHSPSSSVIHETPDVRAPPPHGHRQTRSSTLPDCMVVDPTTPTGVISLNITPGYSGAGHCEDDVQRKQPRSFASAHMAGARKLFDEMPPPAQTSTVDNPYYATFMQNTIFEGCGEAFHVDGQEQAFDPDATQSQDGCGTYDDTQFAGHDDGDEDDHGNSWHEDDDFYCEDEEEEVDISMDPLSFIDELTQKAEAQKRRKSIRTGSYSQAEDTLICESWKEIGQDPIKGAEQKGVVFWTRVHKNFHERRKFAPYQFTSTRGINSIQKRWGFIQQECNKYCATLESVKARPVSGLGLGDLV